MTFALRSPDTADFAALAAWIPDAAACLWWAGPRVTFPFTPDELPALLDITHRTSLCLAEGDGPACGFGQHWIIDPGAVHLGRIIVSPTLRRHGLGEQLCRQLIARAVESSGARRVTLRVYPDNAVALALYQRLGFSVFEQASDADHSSLSMQLLLV